MTFFAEHAALAMGVISFIGGIVTWYRGAVKKNYAAERDFGHLKNNYASLSNNVAHLDEMMDERMNQMRLEQIEAKALLMGILGRLGGDSSQIFNSKK